LEPGEGERVSVFPEDSDAYSDIIERIQERANGDD
jgi:hypothetical protein